jgi:paraquat-inducible protein B
MPERDPPRPSVPESRTVSRRRGRFSAVWLVPLIAALAGAWIAVTRILSQGPTIQITFDTAEGLEAGKTKIHYNGVEVGTLETIRLSADHQSVIATAQMAPRTEDFLVDDTQFWVVSARISGANITGLGTLISGSYIGMEIGTSKKPKREFVALSTPPIVTGKVPGRFFTLKTPNLGSLDRGTPIYFRRLKVGEVASYSLDDDGQALSVKVYVDAPYDQYVNPDTRFWNASGIDVSLDANGLSVQTQSLLSILIGGVAFETPPTDPVLPPAAENTTFTLFTDRSEAFKLPPRAPQHYLLVFDESVRGLTAGAPVEFRGIPIGEVLSVEAQIDAKTFKFSAPVTIDLDAQRLGVKVEGLAPGADIQALRRRLVDTLVARGVRAQLRSGNLLTGAKYIAFDFFPDAPPATIDWSEKPARLPTVPGDLEALEARVASIIKKIDQLPLKEIGQDLRKTIADLDKTLASARQTVDNADKLIQPGSPLGAELGSTLDEVKRAARGLRVLADYLERHPEALIRGKTGDAK